MAVADLSASDGRAGGAGRRLLLVPAYDEAEHLPAVLRAVAAAVPGLPVCVVDDGSRDATSAVARAAGARVLRHPFNLGYGAALQTGYKYALRHGVEFVVQMDADGQHDPREIPMLLEPVERDELDLVIGSRFLVDTDYRMGLARNAGRRLFRAVAKAFGLRVTDPTSGFQALNRAVLEFYVSDFFPHDYPDVDVLLGAHRHGLRIGERSVAMSEGSRASSLHAGWKPFFYVYKMLLSVWAASSRSTRGTGPSQRAGAAEEGP